MFSNRWMQTMVCWIATALTVASAGCGGSAPSPLDAPIRYNSNAELKSRLEEVAKYGDGGSSLGGIPESIAELTKTDPAKGEKLLANFKKLDTTNSKDERRKIAKAMAEQLAE